MATGDSEGGGDVFAGALFEHAHHHDPALALAELLDAAAQTQAVFGVRDEFLHDLADVLYIETRAVVSAVRGNCTDKVADRSDTPLTNRFGALDYNRCRTHAHQHSVAAPIERAPGETLRAWLREPGSRA